MAEAKGKKRKSSRLVLAGGALAAAAVAGAYLSDCIPGMKFGAGSGADAPKEDAEPAEETEQKQTDPNAPLSVGVEDDQCRQAEDALGDCDALCEELSALDPPRTIVIDGTKGIHKTVTELVDCLEQADVSVRLAE